MGKKVKPTVTQSYFQGAVQIDKFVKKELGSERAYQAKSEDYKNRTRKLEEHQINADLIREFNEVLKVDNRRYYETFKDYAKMLKEFFPKAEKKGEKPVATPVTKESLQKLIDANEAVATFMFDAPATIKWDSAVGAKAVGKYADIILKNDIKKMSYVRECLIYGGKDPGFTLEEVLNRPTPVTKEATEADMKDLATKMKELEEKLSKTESLMHSNSSEFNAMKKAIKAVNKGIAEGVEPSELGSRLEVLQAASMNYVNAKGVGTQVTQRGKDRMDAALDICSLSIDGMDFYTSNERRAELEDFEKQAFGQVISEKIENEFVAQTVEVSVEKEENTKDKEEISSEKTNIVYHYNYANTYEDEYEEDEYAGNFKKNIPASYDDSEDEIDEDEIDSL